MRKRRPASRRGKALCQKASVKRNDSQRNARVPARALRSSPFANSPRYIVSAMAGRMRLGESMRRRATGRHSRVVVGAVGVAALVVPVVRAVAVSVGGGEGGPAVREVASEQAVVLFPHAGAGGGGWCVRTVRGRGCPTALRPVSAGPILIEDWTGTSSSTEAPVDKAVVLTTSDAVAVSLEGRAPIPTRAGPGLPDGLRAAVVELRGGSGTRVVGALAPLPFPQARFVALNAAGARISQTDGSAVPLEFEVASQSWGGSASEPPGVCSLELSGLAGLVSEGGSVMTTVETHRDVRGREFVNCASASYRLGAWPIEAYVLVDAARVGATPGPLLAMQALPGHPGVFQAPGVAGQVVARRMPGAWLVAGGGEGLDQRLTVLEHMRAAIHLGSSPSPRHA